MSENDEIFDDFHLPEKENENIDPTINKIVEKEPPRWNSLKLTLMNNFRWLKTPSQNLKTL